MTVFGVHAGLQNTSMENLRSLWRRIESLGFGGISIWDHFYSATLGDDPECLEPVKFVDYEFIESNNSQPDDRK